MVKAVATSCMLLTMAAGIAQLELCLAPGFYKEMEAKTSAFVSRINGYASVKQYDFELISLASIFWLNFNGKKSINIFVNECIIEKF